MKTFTSLLFLFALLALVFGNPVAEADALAEADAEAEAEAFADLESRQAPSRDASKFKTFSAPANVPVCTPCQVKKHDLKAYKNKWGNGPVVERHNKNDWVALQCYTTGKKVKGNSWWDKTVDGRWISEWYMDTPCVYTLPAC